jgi:3-oxoacyl-[acyl-carrier-protein] synthase III
VPPAVAAAGVPPPRRAAVLTGIGNCLPDRAVPNADLVGRLDTSDEWIRSRTGIAQRYFAAPGTATSDLAVGAAQRALKSSGDPVVDAVVLATSTPDRPCPATAPSVASRLGLAGVAAYDIGAVCTGFIYGLATACGLVAAGIADRVLVIGAETYSSILSPDDRSTAVIFGDGAGAVTLRAGEPDEPGAIGPFDLGSDGDGRDLITVRAGGSEQRLSGKPPEPADHYFSMAGKEVFRRAVLRMAASSRLVLGQAGLRTTEVDWLAAHQANIRILLRLAAELGVPPGRCLSNIAEVGNTAAASIPMVLADAHAAGKLRPGDRVLLTAFGGGLTWGSALLSWPDLANRTS